MYTEVSKNYNKTSELQSPLFDPTGIPQCFSMKYHMYGFDIGSLSVFVSQTQMWTLSGNQGNEWKSMSFNVTSPTPFTIVIKSVSGNSWLGDIALDNIFLNTTPCGKYAHIFSSSIFVEDYSVPGVPQSPVQSMAIFRPN